jgi:hypothetical protein
VLMPVIALVLCDVHILIKRVYICFRTPRHAKESGIAVGERLAKVATGRRARF